MMDRDDPDYHAAVIKSAVAMARDRTGHRGRFRYTPDEIAKLTVVLREKGRVWVNWRNESCEFDPLHPPGIAYSYGIVPREEFYP